MIKYFNIFKNDYKEKDTQPDYKLMVKVDEGEEAPLVDAGGCWLKEGKKGKFFSCKLNDVYVDHVKGVAKKGFRLELENSNGNEMPEMAEEVLSKDDAPF